MIARKTLQRLALSLLAATSFSTCALAQGVGDAPSAARAAAPRAAARPNFLVIVADDLGWSDLGAFGGEIRTPNLDALALSGVRLTGFHTAPTCSPTRSMLLSGVDNHEAGLGTMAELRQPDQVGRDGYEGYLNTRVASIAELLRAGGYHTLMAGKWHLGLTEETSPAARGFEQSYALLPGLSNHFGADQSEAWEKAGERSSWREGRALVPYPTGKYVDDQFADKLIGFLGAAAARHDGQPFFAYLTFTAPHWPMQAPAEDIARYKGRYDAGYEALRDQRFARQKALGLIPADARPHTAELARPWASLSAEEKAIEARKMEVYAAMVDRMDQNVGRVVAELKRNGQFDNTVILFLADNGPEGNTINGPKNSTKFNESLHIDNSLANIGTATSYVGYGPGWAEANAAPSRLVKSYPTEGGIRTAAFAFGPGVAGGVSGGGAGASGRIAPGNLSVTDIAPTLLQWAGQSQPASFNGHPILPHEGHSLVPLLAGKVGEVRSKSEPLGYELFYRRALRKGDWKVVYLPSGSASLPYLRSGVGDDRWRLYNVAKDPGETTDLAASEPARLKDLVAEWERYAREKGVLAPVEKKDDAAKAG